MVCGKSYDLNKTYDTSDQRLVYMCGGRYSLCSHGIEHHSTPPAPTQQVGISCPVGIPDPAG